MHILSLPQPELAKSSARLSLGTIRKEAGARCFFVYAPSWHRTSPVLFRPHFSLSLCQACNIYGLFVPADAFTVAKNSAQLSLCSRETAAMIETMRLNEINNYTVRRSHIYIRALFPSVCLSNKLSTERRRDLWDKIGDENWNEQKKGKSLERLRANYKIQAKRAGRHIFYKF